MERPLVDFAQTPSPAPPWDEAGHDVSIFGAALDRVFHGSREQLLVRLVEQRKLTSRERAVLESILLEDAP